MKNTLYSCGKRYNLDVSSLGGEMVWIVIMTDERGNQLTSARISGDQDKVIEKADDWLNAMCQTNPYMFFKYNISRWIDRNRT